MTYKTVIGLEVHVELNTKSKMFCGCATKFGGQANSQCCPICLGMPGTLPAMNKQAVKLGILAGLALNCDISRYNAMDRKSYFYPDLPKGYQITQQFFPICKNGYLNIKVNGYNKKIGITRIHLEEDAGKLIHHRLEGHSLVDYNRAGIPLIEIVTEPAIETPEEAVVFLEELRLLLIYLGVSCCRMAEGGLRCDVNLSMKPEGQVKLGTRTEMKNLNSFRAVYRAINYERQRQLDILESGDEVLQQSLRWEDSKGRGIVMRSKEEALDYRYFSESQILPFKVDHSFIEDIKKEMPELPSEKRKRIMSEYKIPRYDAEILTSNKLLANFFEDCVKAYDDKEDPYKNAKIISNWVMGNVMGLMKDQGIEIQNLKFGPNDLVQLLKLVEDETISGTMAKDILIEMFEEGQSPEEIVKEKGLKQISGRDELDEIIGKVIEENPKSIADLKSGKKKAFGYLVGQTMKKTKGKANPQLVNKILHHKLGDKVSV